MPELKYKDITEKIIGASFEVHKFLGNRFSGSNLSKSFSLGIDASRTILMPGKLNRKYFIKNCRNQLEQEEQTLLWKEKF